MIVVTKTLFDKQMPLSRYHKTTTGFYQKNFKIFDSFLRISFISLKPEEQLSVDPGPSWTLEFQVLIFLTSEVGQAGFTTEPIFNTETVDS